MEFPRLYIVCGIKTAQFEQGCYCEDYRGSVNSECMRLDDYQPWHRQDSELALRLIKLFGIWVWHEQHTHTDRPAIVVEIWSQARCVWCAASLRLSLCHKTHTLFKHIVHTNTHTLTHTHTQYCTAICFLSHTQASTCMDTHT